MRFTTYQKPLGREMQDSSYLPGQQIQHVNDILVSLKTVHDRPDFTITPMFDEMSREQKVKPFKQCYVQDVFGVIGFDGGVYPCTAMAYPDGPKQLCFGNINERPFWDIWKDAHRDFPLDHCYDCTRAEFNINCAIDGLRRK